MNFFINQKELIGKIYNFWVVSMELPAMEWNKEYDVMKKTIEQEEKIAIILSEINKIQSKSSDKEVGEILNHIRHELNCLV